MAEMLHHTRAVVRGTQRALVIGDMPFLSYSTIEEATENAGRFMQEAAPGGQGRGRRAQRRGSSRRSFKAGVPVMGHIGWTPQSQHGWAARSRSRARRATRREQLLHDAIAIQEAGAFSIVLGAFPLAHQVWGGGFLSNVHGGLSSRIFGDTDGVATIPPIDYAGGTVVHINAGVAGLVLALLIGVRKGFGKEPMRPHNLTLTMIGAGLLWFGWFGFNVGSIVFVSADEGDMLAQFTTETGLVWLNTTLATCAAMLGWLLVERIRDGKGTSLGAASGVVAGLVAITPACGALSPLGSMGLGVIAGCLCALAVGLKYRFGYDDSLDVVGVHLVGGLVGTIGIGFFATSTGLLYGEGPRQLVVQVLVAGYAVALVARRHPHRRPGHQVHDGLEDRRGRRGRGHRLHRAR